MLQECKLAFQEASYGLLPMWEVRRNVLLARMPGTFSGLSFKEAIGAFRGKTAGGYAT